MKRKLFLVLVFGLTTTSCWGEWTRLSKNSNGDTYYADMESLHRSGNLRRIWILTDYSEPTEYGDRSSKVHHEYDCKAGRYRYLRSMYYSEAMGGGELTTLSHGPRPWIQPASRSVALSTLQRFCRP